MYYYVNIWYILHGLILRTGSSFWGFTLGPPNLLQSKSWPGTLHNGSTPGFTEYIIILGYKFNDHMIIFENQKFWQFFIIFFYNLDLFLKNFDFFLEILNFGKKSLCIIYITFTGEIPISALWNYEKCHSVITGSISHHHMINSDIILFICYI